jgi:3-oxoacyl-[acyl-carrier protein] reductase
MSEPQFALVTGASEGIGKAIALKLLKQGYRVGMVSRSQAKLDAALAGLGNLKQSAWTYPADLTDPNQVDELIQAAWQHAEHIDVLVNNVGRGIRHELVDTSDEEWDYLVSANLSTAFYVCRSVIPHMCQQRCGNIINIASRAGRRGEGGLAAYCAVKHGLVGLTRALADSEKEFNIRTNAICPGLVATERLMSESPHLDYSKAYSPEDIAEAVSFLLSPAARYMNGQTIDMFSA